MRVRCVVATEELDVETEPLGANIQRGQIERLELLLIAGQMDLSQADGVLKT